ncbi:hypothetical protein MK079_02085 [Candidatus Gracilibacteria bacterium]|nr:hypothetical protein [Candidatus Gracilibacteria bacterium]
MKELHKKALQAYIEMLTIHIDTKTTDPVFHPATEEMYEALFEVAHKLGEKHVDLGGNLIDDSLESKKSQAVSILENLKKDIEDHHASNDVTLGTEDLLGSLANTLEDNIGNAKAFVK